MNRTVVVAALGTAQTLAWGSSYYLPAILADPIAQGTGVSRTVVFGLFSGALLFSVLAAGLVLPMGYGPRAGLLGAPARATQALAPVLFGLLLDRMGIASIAISIGLCLAAFLAQFLLKARAEPAPATA